MIMVESLVALCIVILIVGLICGLVVYLIDASPIPSPFKEWGRWLVIVVAVLIIVMKALPLVGVSI